MVTSTFLSGNRFFYGLLLPVTMLLLCACSKDSDEPEPTPSTSVKFTIDITSPNMESILLNTGNDTDGIDTYFKATYNEGATKSVVLKQDGKFYNLGEITLSMLSNARTEGRIAVDASGKISSSKPYDAYVIGGRARWDNTGMYYQTPLARGGSFSTWNKLSSSSIPQKMMGNISGTAEMLFVINKSGSTIKFRHKGFDVKDRWYYTYAEVSMDNGKVVNQEYGNEVVSTEVGINPSSASSKSGLGYRIITSTYVPNGNKIQEAQLIAEIDGKEVRSENRISSDIALQANHVYAMFAVWDGVKLTIGEDESGNGIIELPEDANISMGDITVMADGATVDINNNGTFQTESNSVIALGKDDRVIYKTYASVEFGAHKNDIKLNAEETAISLLLPSIVGFMDVDTDETLNKLKRLIAELPETKALSQSIDASILKNGYFDINDVDAAYKIAHEKIGELMGIKEIANHFTRQNARQKSRRNASTVHPIEPSVMPYEPLDTRMGFTLMSSEWKTGDESRVWSCNFTATSVRFGNMTVLHGKKDKDGNISPYPTDYERLFKYVVPAYSIKTTLDRMSTFSEYKNQMLLLSLSFKDGHFHGMDESIKKDVIIDFQDANDGILALGPDDLTEMFVYNIVSVGICPLIKAVGAKFMEDLSDGDNKENKSKDEKRQENVSKFMTGLMMELMKANLMADFYRISQEDREPLEQIEAIFTIAWPTLQKFVIEQLKSSASSSAKDAIFAFTSEKIDIKSFDKLFKEETKWIKECAKAADWILGLALGSQESGVYVGMNLDFNIPNAGLDDMPGHNY